MAFAAGWMKKEQEEDESQDSLSAVAVSSPPRGPRCLPGGYRLPSTTKSFHHPLGLGAVPRHLPPIVPLAPPASSSVAPAGLPVALPPAIPAACPPTPPGPRAPFLCHVTREGLRCSCNRFVACIFALVCLAVLSVGTYGLIIIFIGILIVVFQVFL